MMELSLQQVADFCGGGLLQGEGSSLCRKVSTDSRKTGPGDLFVALAGERFDAHDFLSQVAASGVAAMLVSRVPDDLGEGDWKGGLIKVADTLVGLQSLAKAYRRLLDPLVIGVTGSNGKTSTKDLLSTLLGCKYRTAATLGNLNNHIGVPLTLLAMEPGTEAVVVEMGMNHFGEIEVLANIAAPDVAVITNIGIAHIEYMGSREGIAKEKGMLVEAISPGGMVILNANDDMTPSLRARSKAQVLTAGVGTGDVKATLLGTDAKGARFLLDFAGQETVEVALPVVGAHMVGNAALAAACAWHQGVSPTQIAEALGSVKLSKGRLQVKVVEGITFLDDSYNANPDSMRAGLKTLAEFSSSGRRVAVLGRMGELGVHAESAHIEIGEFAAGSGIDLLCTVGGDEAESMGLAAGKVRGDLAREHFASHGECAAYLRGWLKSDDVVLLKGSRAAGMEQVLSIFETS
ncbi:UDP-N-acetylmuramoyl-tripeptide--D-alanyl-D-alanine ligase [Phragmitibacter flavus]|uniref:UDP-N-acetylmuramoyl-tripeptide--D-alanyl-D-alanine ligase n=1 Tax=Phragmitibacter flavus TaxID=2576071 RepID=A0A5R8K9I1_9BACT|nr:UDP-N-acetylmuramoyl-tripeptide--D-alanyl-D-alanine ligase [Phragmitibacter flavus]TLD68992.1 UDP-N-acetylmuramoyl-tripeptide--D-alanyl-D-alanine ligase [Phragmitibacter flavus]